MGYLIKIEADVHVTVFFHRQIIIYFKACCGGRIIGLLGGLAINSLSNISPYATRQAAIGWFNATKDGEAKDINITVKAKTPGVLNSSVFSQILEGSPAGCGKHYFKNIPQIFRDLGVAIKTEKPLCINLAFEKADNFTDRLVTADRDFSNKLDRFSIGIEETDFPEMEQIILKGRDKNWGKAA